MPLAKSHIEGLLRQRTLAALNQEISVLESITQRFRRAQEHDGNRLNVTDLIKTPQMLAIPSWPPLDGPTPPDPGGPVQAPRTGSVGCVTGDTLVETADGDHIPISEVTPYIDVPSLGLDEGPITIEKDSYTRLKTAGDLGVVAVFGYVVGPLGCLDPVSISIGEPCKLEDSLKTFEFSGGSISASLGHPFEVLDPETNEMMFRWFGRDVMIGMKINENLQLVKSDGDPVEILRVSQHAAFDGYVHNVIVAKDRPELLASLAEKYTQASQQRVMGSRGESLSKVMVDDLLDMSLKRTTDPNPFQVPDLDQLIYTNGLVSGSLNLQAQMGVCLSRARIVKSFPFYGEVFPFDTNKLDWF